jgi:hypothetical protein
LLGVIERVDEALTRRDVELHTRGLKTNSYHAIPS